MIKIAQGSDGWWFDGDHFYRRNPAMRAKNNLRPGGCNVRESELPIEPGSPEARKIVEALCIRLFNLKRWQGEPGLFGPVSVGYHSLLVAELARRLAIVRGLNPDVCQRAGAAHDLGEALGLGDIAAPWIRGCIDLRALNERHQRAAERLLGVGGTSGKGDPFRTMADLLDDVDGMVKDADNLAVGIERRYLYVDDSRDMESPDVERLISELGLDRINVDNSTANGAALFEARGGQCLATPLDGPSQLVAICGC